MAEIEAAMEEEREARKAEEEREVSRWLYCMFV